MYVQGTASLCRKLISGELYGMRDILHAALQLLGVLLGQVLQWSVLVKRPRQQCSCRVIMLTAGARLHAGVLVRCAHFWGLHAEVR